MRSEKCFFFPGAKGWQVSGLRERGAGGRAGTRSERSGRGGWWSKVAGTTKGGVTGGSGQEGGAPAGARVCTAAAGAGGVRTAREEKEEAARPSPPGESGELASSAQRQRPASRRGARAGREEAGSNFPEKQLSRTAG